MRRGDFNSAIHSFEMFLDIICNAFGGIIFIALLLCIMLQVTGGALTASQEVQVKKQQDFAAEITRLENMLDVQNQQLAVLQKNSDDKKLSEYLELQKKITEKETQINSINEAARLAKEKRDSLDSQLALEEHTNRELLKKLRELAEKNISRSTKSGILLSVPHEQHTSKTPVNLLLRNGRLVFLNVYDSNGNPTGRNVSQVKITQSGDQSAAMLIDGAGLSIEPSDDNDSPETRQTKITQTRAAITGLLKKFPPEASIGKKAFYLNIAVWEDSFEQFETLRDALIEMKYDYNLIPVERNKPIPLKKTGDKIIQ